MSESWSRLEVLLLVLALCFPVGAGTSHFYNEMQTRVAGTQVVKNVRAIAASTNAYHNATDRWFPVSAKGHARLRVFPNPFDEHTTEYQSLDKALFARENNHGMVLQLVSYDENKDGWLNDHGFNSRFQSDDPYLRILLDYGSEHQRERAILRQLQQELNNGVLAKLDDHLFVLDLRGLDYE
jgi:hypothetical protein